MVWKKDVLYSMYLFSTWKICYVKNFFLELKHDIGLKKCIFSLLENMLRKEFFFFFNWSTIVVVKNNCPLFNVPFFCLKYALVHMRYFQYFGVHLTVFPFVPLIIGPCVLAISRFNPVVGGGANGSTIHYSRNDKKVKANDWQP